jgi:thioredoxin reductase (NADPH)
MTPNDCSPIIDCLVVGAGPAGLTAALYLRRFHRRVIVADAGASRALRIPKSHNYPGFPDGVTGAELLDRLRRQFADVGGEVARARVTGIVQGDGGFVADVAGARIMARNVLLATGVVDNEPPLPGVEALRAAGLLRQCPICDGYEHTGRRIGVVGRGEHGVRETLFLRDFSDDVWFVGVGERDLDEAACRALADRGVSCILGGVLELGCLRDGGVRLAMRDGGEHRFDVLYSALGARPQSHLAAALGARLDECANVVVDAHCATGIPGLYAAGDVVSALDQIAVATGHAAIAATAIHNRLRQAG